MLKSLHMYLEQREHALDRDKLERVLQWTMTKGGKSGSSAWLFALFITNSAFPGVKIYDHGLAALTKLASLVETQLRDQLVYCGSLLGAYEALSYT